MQIHYPLIHVGDPESNSQKRQISFIFPSVQQRDFKQQPKKVWRISQGILRKIELN